MQILSSEQVTQMLRLQIIGTHVLIPVYFVLLLHGQELKLTVSNVRLSAAKQVKQVSFVVELHV